MTAQVVTYPVVSKKEGLTKIQISFASTDAGAVVGAVVTDANGAARYVTGPLIGWAMYPDPTTTTPTAAFTFTVKDDDGVDLLNGLGAGTSTATAQVIKGYSDCPAIAWNTKLTFAAAAMGDAKHALLNLYFG